MNKKVSIGVAGLGFGLEFAAIYCDHPDVDKVAICTRNPETLKNAGELLGIPEELRFTDFNKMAECEELDAIHVITPIAEHYPQTMKALREGKHTACTVPMALTVQELKDIVQASRESGKIYTMMETSLYTREYLYVKKLRDEGKLGRIQYVYGDHMQNMSLEGWGGYWQGFPQFWYGTHVLSPLLDIVGTNAKSVRCLGSGRVLPERAEVYGCKYAVETATFRLKDSDVVAEAHRCLFDTIRQCREGFNVYGDKLSFEWEDTLDEGHTLYMGIDDFEKFTAPDAVDSLPEPIRKYAYRENLKDPNQPSCIQGMGHGGSHPQLCHEFVRAILEKREPYMSATRSADYTVAGICAQESAFRDGEEVQVPDFDELFPEPLVFR